MYWGCGVVTSLGLSPKICPFFYFFPYPTLKRCLYFLFLVLFECNGHWGTFYVAFFCFSLLLILIFLKWWCTSSIQWISKFCMFVYFCIWTMYCTISWTLIWLPEHFASSRLTPHVTISASLSYLNTKARGVLPCPNIAWESSSVTYICKHL